MTPEDIDIAALARVVREFDAEEEAASLRESGEHPQCKFCGGDYLLRDGCEVVALCDHCTHEAVPALLDALEHAREKLANAERERDEARMLLRDSQIQAQDRGASYQEVTKQRDLLAERCIEHQENRERLAQERDEARTLLTAPEVHWDCQQRLDTAQAERDEARAELQHAVSENFAFNLKVATEINMARLMRDSLESRLANWLEGYGDEPINAALAANAVRSGAWRSK